MVKPFVISLAVGVITGASAAYPATFPFENESTEIVYPPAATPISITNGVVDPDDPGGYYYTYLVADTVFAPGEAWINNGFYQHYFVTAWEIDPKLPYSMFNCTARGEFFDETAYSFDSIAGHKFCDSPEECCTQFHGLMKYRRVDDDSMETDMEMWASQYEQGMCSEMFHQATFCSVLNEYLWGYCNENLITDTERLMYQTCFDSWQHWFSNCPVFKNTVSKMEGPEPAVYIESMSTAEYLNWDALFWLPDKVCAPYSYYFPEYAKDADAGTDVSKYTESGASESTGAVVAASFIVLASLM